MLAQSRDRMVKEHNEAVERASQGLPAKDPPPPRRKGRGAAMTPKNW